MKKSIKIIVIIIILVSTILYINSINNYKITKKEQKKINAIADRLVIKDIKSVTPKELDNYYEYKNIKFIDLTDELDCHEDNNSLLCTNEKKEFIINIEDSLLAKYKKTNYKSIKGSTIVKNNNIKDDISLLGYIKETKDFNPYFKTKNEIKKTYSLQRFAIDNLKEFNSLDLINTPYEGYIYNIDSNIKEYIYTKDNINYSFTFKDLNYFTKSKRNEIISTIVIE